MNLAEAPSAMFWAETEAYTPKTTKKDPSPYCSATNPAAN